MHNATCLALIAAALLSGLSMAGAAGSGKSSTGISSPSMPAGGTPGSGMSNNGISNNGGSGSAVLNKGISGPSGSGTSNPSTAKHTGSGAASPSMPATAQDSLTLDLGKRQTAWRDIIGLALKEKAPSGFTPRVGMVVSSQLTTHPIPVSTASKVPELRPYSYALLEGNQVLIVNPNDKKIAEIITR